MPGDAQVDSLKDGPNYGTARRSLELTAKTRKRPPIPPPADALGFWLDQAIRAETSALLAQCRYALQDRLCT